MPARRRTSRTPVASPAASPEPRSSRNKSPATTPRASPKKSPKKKKAEAEAEAAPVTLLVDQGEAAKWASWWKRTWWSLAMVTSFLLIVFVGRQPATLVLVFVLQGLMYKEMVKIAFSYQKEREMPNFRRLYYYWFFVVVFYVYGRALYPHFAVHEFDEVLGVRVLSMLKHHTFISFALYAGGIMAFVMSLRQKKLYRYQFSQFGYAHVTLLVIVVQSTSLVTNMFEGLIWFLMPCSLVITNDVFAYICGFFWGRTPLIKLSPKKTWEGFLGATVITLVFAFFFSRFLSWFDVMICPHRGFSFQFEACEPDPIFLASPLSEYSALQWLTPIAPTWLMALTVQPLQWHMVLFGVFASIVAPFGGFFASGFKRAFDVKDFGDSIPGHGGVTDRMDCQIIMGMFAYVYYTGFIHRLSYAQICSTEALALAGEDQLALYRQLGASLSAQGLLP